MSISETYLERFIENVGTIPQEIRRNLAQMRSLDQTYLSLQQHLRDNEEDYLKRSHDIIHSYNVASKSKYKLKKNKRIKTDAAAVTNSTADGTAAGTADGTADGTAANTTTTTTGNKTNGDNDNHDNQLEEDEDENMSTSSNTSSQESELDETYFQIKHHEGIIVPLQSGRTTNVTTDADADADADDNTDTNTNTQSPSSLLEKDANADTDTKTTNETDEQHQDDQHGNHTNDNNKKNTNQTTNHTTTTSSTLVVPTTEELRQQIQNPAAVLQIAILRKTAREMVEEKLSNANQTFNIVQDAISRLDSDIQEFEDMLKVTGQYDLIMASSVAAANAAFIAAASGSGGMGIGMGNGMGDNGSNSGNGNGNGSVSVSNGNSNARNSHSHGHGHGHNTVRVGPQKDDLAAIQVMPNSPDWILAKVISHEIQSGTGLGMYNLSDEDIESNKTFLLPEAQVVILGNVERLSLHRAEVIYGVYPDTTSFYQATVVEMPKRIPGKDPLVLVHFKDDGDENGITHAKAVPMKHVMKVPYGAIK